MLHFFDPEIAVQYGVNEAIFIQNLRYWIQFNQANEKHFYDGRYWTFNSQKAFSQLFPYWSPRQVRHIVDKLKQEGAIEVGFWNEDKTDRTQWYTLRQDLLIKGDLPKQANASDKNVMLHLTNLSHAADKFVTSHIYTDRNSNVYTDVEAPKRANALTHTSTPRVPSTPAVKKSMTIADLVAEGINEDHARDWLIVRGKKALTQTAWARLKSDAEKHQVSIADAVKVCAENGWIGLNHDGAARVFADTKKKQDPKHWEPEDPNKICISPTGEKWFMGRRII